MGGSEYDPFHSSIQAGFRHGICQRYARYIVPLFQLGLKRGTSKSRQISTKDRVHRYLRSVLNTVFILILHITWVQINHIRVSGTIQNNDLCNLTYITSGTSNKVKVLTLFFPNLLHFLHLHEHSPSSRAEFVNSCHRKNKCGSYQNQRLQCSLTLIIILHKQRILTSMGLRGWPAEHWCALLH